MPHLLLSSALELLTQGRDRAEEKERVQESKWGKEEKWERA